MEQYLDRQNGAQPLVLLAVEDCVESIVLARLLRRDVFGRLQEEDSLRDAFQERWEEVG
jgi:hypothetical protein